MPTGSEAPWSSKVSRRKYLLHSMTRMVFRGTWEMRDICSRVMWLLGLLLAHVLLRSLNQVLFFATVQLRPRTQQRHATECFSSLSISCGLVPQYPLTCRRSLKLLELVLRGV